LERIGKKIAAGVAYNTISRLLIVAIQGVTSILLARILASSDYGIVTFAAIFVSFLSQFSDFGLGSALVQRKEIDQSVLNTAFTMRNIVAIFLVIIAVIISFIVPYFFEYPHLAWVIRLMALNFVLNSIGFVSAALLKREMNFLSTNIAVLFSTAAGSIVSVLLAYMGYGFWSLVWANLASSTIYVIAIKSLKPCKLKYEFNKKAAHEMWRFGSYLLISGIMVYAQFNGANFIVGAVTGAVALGYFSLALDWGTKIPTLLSQTVLSVLFPAFSKIREDEELLMSTYLNTVKYVAFLSILVNVTLICISEDFLRIVLGNGTDKWLPALNALRILCLYGIARAVLEPIGGVITALGETRILMKATALAALVQLGLLYHVLKYYGLEGIAWLVLMSYALQYCLYLHYLNRRAGIGLRVFGKAIYAPLLSLISFLISYLLVERFISDSSFIVVTAVAIFYGGTYALTFNVLTKFQLFYDFKLVLRK
jgi:lipopolysaccharide exporter